MDSSAFLFLSASGAAFLFEEIRDTSASPLLNLCIANGLRRVSAVVGARINDTDKKNKIELPRAVPTTTTGSQKCPAHPRSESN